MDAPQSGEFSPTTDELLDLLSDPGNTYAWGGMPAKPEEWANHG